MTVKVVTDSVSDIPSAVADELGVTVVPLTVLFGGTEYLDGIDITTEEFYRKLENSKVLPSTGSPSPKLFCDVYERLSAGGDDILVITIGDKLSATPEAALNACELMSGSCRIKVIPSDVAMMAEGLLVIAAARAAQDGATLDELIQLTERNMERVSLRIAFDTLEYLKRGGRIGRAQAMVGSMFGINPILGIKDGEMFPFARERSRTKAMDYLYEFVAGFKSVDAISVEDATTPEEADALVERFGNLFDKERIYRAKVSPVIGTNVGPRAIGVAVLGDLQ